MCGKTDVMSLQHKRVEGKREPNGCKVGMQLGRQGTYPASYQASSVTASRGPGGGMVGEAFKPFRRPRLYRGHPPSARPVGWEKAQLSLVHAGPLGA